MLRNHFCFHMLSKVKSINGGTLTQFIMLNKISESELPSTANSHQPRAQCHSLIDISECPDSMLPPAQSSRKPSLICPNSHMGIYCPSCLLIDPKSQLILETWGALTGATYWPLLKPRICRGASCFPRGWKSLSSQ